MKVLFIHCAYQYRGGEDTVVDEEIKLLKGVGVDVELLQFSNEGGTLLKILQLPFNFASYRRVVKKIKAFGPDVVHVHNLHFAASPSVVYAVKRMKVPLVCTLHNYRLLCPSATLFDKGELFLDSIKATFPAEAVRRGVYKNSKLLTLWMALSMQLHHWLGTWTKPDRLIVLTKHAKTLLLQAKKKFAPDQLVLKPNFSTIPPPDKTKKINEFVYIGRLSPEKGLPVLLQAFAASSYKLVIAGDGPLREEVLAYSNRYSNISYAGSLQKQEVIDLLRRSTALVFPSIWYEGMPLTIIEAFACGTPVIASHLGAMEDMITQGHDGLHFAAGDKISLLQALTTWSNLPEAEKERYAINARTTYEELYTPQKNSEQLLSIYHTVQQESGLPSIAFSTNSRKIDEATFHPLG